MRGPCNRMRTAGKRGALYGRQRFSFSGFPAGLLLSFMQQLMAYFNFPAGAYPVFFPEQAGQRGRQPVFINRIDL